MIGLPLASMTSAAKWGVGEGDEREAGAVHEKVSHPDAQAAPRCWEPGEGTPSGLRTDLACFVSSGAHELLLHLGTRHKPVKTSRIDGALEIK